jgi:polysaccharide chain length determinant protein (PEP-CTERM system associated)
MHELAEQLLTYLRATWRNRWYAIAFAWVAAVGGWIVVYKMPDRYEASARVYVDTQSILRPMMAGLAVQPNIDQIVMMISRTLITRPNLDKVIRMADMDIRLKSPEAREQLITSLSKTLTISNAGRDNVYNISYAAGNPQDAKRVVQSLLTLFVEGGLGDKRKDTDSAQRFIEEQLKVYSERLVAAESAVTEFKREHVGIMGGEGRNYYQQLVAAKTGLSQAMLDLQEAENARDAIKKQISGESEAPPSLLDDQQGPVIAANPEIDARIKPLQEKLDNLRLNYTEQHPDIVAITRTIAQLKEQKQREAKLKKPGPTVTQTQNPIYLQLSVSLTEAEANVASMKARVAEYNRRFNDLKASVNSVPQVEAEFTQLTRDYEVLKRNYESLLARRESAQISGDMESNAKVMEFRVIDPPQVPATPSAPNRLVLMSMVLLAAVGGGVGFAFLLSQLRPTFHDERRLQEVSGVPVFGSVVMAWTESQRAKRKKGLMAFLLSFASLLSAYAAIMAALMLSAARA